MSAAVTPDTDRDQTADNDVPAANRENEVSDRQASASTAWPVLLAAVVIVGLVLAGVLPDSVVKNDPSFYAERIAPLFEGQLPYFQFDFEHLPLAMVPMALAGVIERISGYSNYPIIFWVLMSAVMFGVGYYVERVGRNLGFAGSGRRWVFIAAGVIPLVTFRVDGISLLLTLMAFAYMIEARERASVWAMAGGIAAKGWPVTLAIVDWWRGRRRRALLTVSLTALAGLVLLTIPGFTSGRAFTGIHIETLSGSLVGLFRTATTSSARTVLNAGASYVDVGAWALLLNLLVGLSLAIGILKVLRSDFTWDKAAGILGVSIIALLLASPLLSAQFVIWLTPFAALTRNKRINIGAGVVALLTGIIVMFWHIDTVWWWSVIVVRNLALIWLGWIWAGVLSRGSTRKENPVRSRPDSPKPLALWVVPLVLASIAPGLMWVVIIERPTSIRTEMAFAMSFAVALVALIVLAIVSRGFGHRLRWSLSITTIIMIVLFQWPMLNRVGAIAVEAFRVPVMSDVVPVVVATALLWLATRNGHEWQFASLVGMSLAVVVLGLLFIGSPRVLTKPSATAVSMIPTQGTDMVVLVLDGYSSRDVLAAVFGHDNTSFYNDLENLGFVIPQDATANYSYTEGAMASILDLDYVLDEGWLGLDAQEDLRQALSGDPDLYRVFHEAGYEVSYAENAWSGSYCGPTVDICWRDGLGERVVWNLSRMSIFAPVVEKVLPHPFNTISLEQLNALPDMVGRQRTSGVPRLTVAHVILPHPPLLLDKACARQTLGPDHPELGLDPELLERRRSHFADQVECVNSRILHVVGQIIAEYPEAVVMMTADHGSELTRPENADLALWSDDELASRMQIFSAYRLPGCNQQVGSTLTPVNGIRLATNCALGTELLVLPDRNYWVTSRFAGIVLDVSERVEATFGR